MAPLIEDIADSLKEQLESTGKLGESCALLRQEVFHCLQSSLNAPSCTADDDGNENDDFDNMEEDSLDNENKLCQLLILEYLQSKMIQDEFHKFIFSSSRQSNFFIIFLSFPGQEPCKIQVLKRGIHSHR